jgi:FixJ family two-component response regulator
MSHPPRRKAPRSVVFVVDDDASVRTAVARLLGARGFDVLLFESGEAFLDADPQSESACVLLDLQMPGLTGLAMQEQMNDRDMLFPVVFVSGHADVPATVRAMKAGAVDFLQKPFDEGDLMGAIDQALALHAKRVDRLGRSEDIGSRLARLTPREAQVMELVVAGLRNRAVAVELGISERTVKVHRGRVMKKLQADSLPDLVRLVELRDEHGVPSDPDHMPRRVVAPSP